MKWGWVHYSVTALHHFNGIHALNMPMFIQLVLCQIIFYSKWVRLNWTGEEDSGTKNKWTKHGHWMKAHSLNAVLDVRNTCVCEHNKRLISFLHFLPSFWLYHSHLLFLYRNLSSCDGFCGTAWLFTEICWNEFEQNYNKSSFQNSRRMIYWKLIYWL